MRKFSYLLVPLLAVLSMTFAIGASVANASTTYTATTSLTNRPDSGNNANNGGDWAVDTLTRTATLVDLGVDPHRPGFDTYSFGLVDAGTFVTDAAASNPNGLNPLTLIKPVSGKVSGTGTWTEFDVASSIHPSTAGVPSTQDGAGTPSSDWLAFFFKKYVNTSLCPATGLDSLEVADNCGQETQFSYSYTTCSEHWLDANTDNDGNAQGVTSTTDLATIGGISGAACPTPTPTPTPTGTSTPPITGVPTGGVQTGGGLPSDDTSAAAYLIPIAALFLLTLGWALKPLFAVRRNH